MGVWGLNKFIRGSVENGYFLVNIKEEIHKWKREHQNTEPIIVFDFLCLSSRLSYNVFNDKYDYFSGGRHNLIIEDFRSFFKTIKEFGAKLVFFMDGSLQDNKYKTWCTRHDLKYQTMIDILTDIYKKRSNKEIYEKYHFNMPLISTVISALINVAKEFGEMKKTYYVECDMAIVDYAGKNKAMAVVGDDTDFIIFEGSWKFWSAIDLNMQNITSMEYNKIGLCKQLNLSAKKMTLFAAIYGGGYMDIKRRGTFSFDNAIKYIRQFPNELQNSDIMKIVNDCYNNNLKYGNYILQDIENTVKDNLNSYNMVNMQELPQLEDELLINAFNDNDGYIFEILKNLPIKITVLYFDYTKDDFKNYYDLIERLTCRQMGVLLKHENNPELTRKIITKKSHDTNYQEYQVKPEYPIIEIPFTLNEFLFDKSLDRNIRWIKYSLLCWIITDVVKPEKLLKIPKEYLVTVLTLIYMRENDQISLNEADAILKSINVAENIQDDFQPTDNNNERAFRLAFLFTKLYGHIKRCLCYVGLKDMIGDLRFDGLYFKKVYVDFCVTKMDRKQYAESIKSFNMYRLYKINE